MDKDRQVIWFWQRIVSPHMAGLARELSHQGCEVTYIAEQLMSTDRARQGWVPPELGDVQLKVAASPSAARTLVASAPLDSIHICQGIRSNGLVNVAQRALASRRLKQWVVMETVDDHGWRGVLKRLEYRRLFALWQGRIEGVLATGLRTPDWVVARGVAAEKVFPFAYFLPDSPTRHEEVTNRTGKFRFVFVGQFIERKRLNLLIQALAAMDRVDLELAVIGSGPQESHLRTLAESTLPGRVDWIRRLPMEEVLQELTKADCLVLPSRHDGWGAVVSEALMAGTPAICSDTCGSAVVVQASGYGGVFRSGDVESLRFELMRMLGKGKLTGSEKQKLAEWSRCLGSDAGALYLKSILGYVEGSGARPSPFWQLTREISP